MGKGATVCYWVWGFAECINEGGDGGSSLALLGRKICSFRLLILGFARVLMDFSCRNFFGIVCGLLLFLTQLGYRT